jgi:colicin import membrane protein
MAGIGKPMSPEEEAKARDLLTQVSATAFANRPPVAPAPASNLTDKQIAREAKERKHAEEVARREFENMQAEAKAKARDEARKKAEAEAQARKESAQTTAAIQAHERDELRKRAAAEAAARKGTETAMVKTPEPAPQVKPLKAQPNIAPVPTTPALPESDANLPADKRQRLSALLSDYIKDKITPEQYHAERAKIIAEP